MWLDIIELVVTLNLLVEPSRGTVISQKLSRLYFLCDGPPEQVAVELSVAPASVAAFLCGSVSLVRW